MMQWYNEPPQWQHDDAARTLTVTSGPKTDFWRKTHYGFVRDNGNFYYETVTGDFTVAVQVTGRYETLYDQAGLMVRADETTWVKCGIEYVDGVQYVSAVVTRDFSDWSVVTLDNPPESVWFRLKRAGGAIEIFYSRDGEQFTMYRTAQLSPAASLQVGMMCASPESDGFSATFSSYTVTRAG